MTVMDIIEFRDINKQDHYDKEFDIKSNMCLRTYGMFFPATSFFLLQPVFLGFLDPCLRVLEVNGSS